MTVTSCTLSANGARDSGGAIYNDVGSTLTVSASTLFDNFALSGGALYNAGTATISSSTFNGNFTTGITFGIGDGGAIDNVSTGTLSVSGGSLVSNLASGRGGAIFNDGGTASLDGCRLFANIDFTGDFAVVNYGPVTFGTLTISNCAFSGHSGFPYIDGPYIDGGGNTFS